MGKMYVRQRVGEGGRIQLFSRIKNATSKVELVQLCSSVWHLKSGLKPWGMLACITFINLITEVLIWWRERRDSTQLQPHSFDTVCESDHRCRTKTQSECGPRLNSLRRKDGDTLSEDWRRVIWWCLRLKTNCRISLTSLASLFLIVEKRPLMDLSYFGGAKC